MPPISPATASPEPIALYIHWPFCLAKCPYCDFNSHVRPEIDQARYAAALLRELETEAARLGPCALGSIFFGGGTPSLMAPDTVAALIARAHALFPPAAGASEVEVTLEANPTSIEAGRFRAYRQAGVNRVSIGVQALDDRALKALGRQHDARQARAALALGREIFPRLSFDLIYARPGQGLPAWRAELAQALALAADHLALYQLTIEPGTGFANAHARGEIVLPAPDDAALLYDATAEEAARYGLLPYEISNYARPGSECRHNLTYWRYGAYAGIGPGAHGRIEREGMLWATSRIRTPETWAAAVEAGGLGLREETALAPDIRAREALLMGLRLAEGIAPARFQARTGVALAEAIEARALGLLIEEGYMAWLPEGRLAATAEGRVRLDAILPLLVR